MTAFQKLSPFARRHFDFRPGKLRLRSVKRARFSHFSDNLGDRQPIIVRDVEGAQESQDGASRHIDAMPIIGSGFEHRIHAAALPLFACGIKGLGV